LKPVQWKGRHDAGDEPIKLEDISHMSCMEYMPAMATIVWSPSEARRFQSLGEEILDKRLDSRTIEDFCNREACTKTKE